MTKWHKGPPPSEGWWPASIARDSDVFRWVQDGRWGLGLPESASSKQAERYAQHPYYMQDEIEWTDRPASWGGKGDRWPK